MKKKILSALVIFAIMLVNVMPVMVKAEDGDVWIDNTVDKSVTNVVGVIKVKNLKTGEETSTKLYDEATSSTYSNPSNPTVEAMINEAKEMVINKAKEYKADFDVETIVVNESTGKVWDNRKYETIEDGDAVLIGDTEYLEGATGNNPTKKTHVASGDYGKESFYQIEAYVEVSGESKLEILEGADQTYVKGSNKDIVIKASGALADLKGIEIDNGNPISEENMVLTEGSTVLTLKAAFLEKSSLGEHTITFKYDGAEVETKLTVVEKEEELATADEKDEEKPAATVDTEKLEENPQTGDNIFLYISILGLSMVSLIGALIYLRKKSLN